MNKIQSILSIEDRPLMANYLRGLAALYLVGSVFYFSQLMGMGDAGWEEMPGAWKIATGVYAQLTAVTAIGLWLKKPWGMVCFFVTALSQIILFWGFAELFAFNENHGELLQGITNIHISTLAIFAMLHMKEQP